MFQFRVQKDLHEPWFKEAVAQAEYHLMPLRGQFRSATISLYTVDDGTSQGAPGIPPSHRAAGRQGNPERLYTCAVKINGLEAVTCQHSDPRVALAQAMARTRRSLTRRAQVRQMAGL